jgi:hypothetical protein
MGGRVFLRVLDVRHKNQRSRLLVRVERVGIARLVVDRVEVVRSFEMGCLWKEKQWGTLVWVLEWGFFETTACFF